MGEMNLSPVMGSNFQYYVPVAITVVCFLVGFDIIDRMMRLLGFKEDLFADPDEGTWGEAEDGKILIAQVSFKRV